MSSKDEALAFIQQCEDASLTPEGKVQLLGLRDYLLSLLQKSRDLDVALGVLVKEPKETERAKKATALKSSLPGLLGEDCSKEGSEIDERT